MRLSQLHKSGILSVTVSLSRRLRWAHCLLFWGQGHSAEIISMGFSTDGRLMITGSFDHTVSVWDTHSGKWVHLHLQSPSHDVKCACFFSRTISSLWDYTELMDYELEILSLRILSCIVMTVFTLYRRIHTLIGHRAEISSAQFNYDCSVIATGSMDKTCKLWDVASGMWWRHLFPSGLCIPI